jgi:hypothetical protein
MTKQFRAEQSNQVASSSFKVLQYKRKRQLLASEEAAVVSVKVLQYMNERASRGVFKINTRVSSGRGRV